MSTPIGRAEDGMDTYVGVLGLRMREDGRMPAPQMGTHPNGMGPHSGVFS